MRRTVQAVCRTLACSAIGACMALALGCVPRTDLKPPSSAASSDVDAGPTGPGAIWPFWPTTMNVHPLTRFASDPQTGRTMLEARIEFQDAQGDRTKAVGQLVLELREAGTPGNASSSEPVQIWNQDLREPALNQRQYDVVTRTYLFRLEIEADKIPRQPELHAYFVSSNGQKMEAALKIR